jgi:hypothetical protein
MLWRSDLSAMVRDMPASAAAVAALQPSYKQKEHVFLKI